MIEKLNFLIGRWKMNYNIPKSTLSDAAVGKGEGEFKWALNNQYIFFDYQAEFENESAKAHGIFTYDAKAGIFRYWWFENSGAFMTATCNLADDRTILMNWHNSLLTQSIERLKTDKLCLRMSYPINPNQYELALEVIFYRL